MTDIKKYSLTGFANIYNVLPSFVYPLFENDNNLYFQDGKESAIDSFIKIIDRRNLNNVYYIPDKKEEPVVIGSSTIYAFQIDKCLFIYGDVQYIYRFIESYIKYINDKYVIQELTEFLNDNKGKTAKKNIGGFLNIYSSNNQLVTLAKNKLSSSLLFTHNNNSNLVLPLHDFVYHIYNANSKNSSFNILIQKSLDNHGINLDERTIDETMNKKLYHTFCNLIKEYISQCIDMDYLDEESCKEFVQHLLIKKKWLLPPDQYSIVISKYSSDYLNPNPNPNSFLRKRDIHSLYKLENNALNTLNRFLTDILEDRGILINHIDKSYD